MVSVELHQPAQELIILHEAPVSGHIYQYFSDALTARGKVLEPTTVEAIYQNEYGRVLFNVFNRYSSENIDALVDWSNDKKARYRMMYLDGCIEYYNAWKKESNDSLAEWIEEQMHPLLMQRNITARESLGLLSKAEVLQDIECVLDQVFNE